MATARPKSSSALINPSRVNAAVDRELVSDSIAVGVMFALVLTIGQRVVGFGRVILFCRLMTDQQLGQWSMVWSYLMLLAPLAVLGLPGCFGKFTEHFRKRGQLRTFIARISWVSVAMTLLVSGSIIVFPGYFSWLLFRDDGQTGLVRFLAIALVIVATSNFAATLMESLCQVKTVTIMRFITGVMFAIIGTAMLMIWEDAASAATVAFAISCFIGMLPAAWVLWKYRTGIRNEGEPLTHSVMWKRIAPFAIWLWASNFLNNLFEVSDRYMLIHWSNLPADLAHGSVGQYHSGRVVPLLMVSVAAMLSGILMPYLSQAWELGNKLKAASQLNWSLKLISLSFTAGGALILFFAPILFEGILQGRYNDGLSVLPLTLVYCIWFSLMTVAQNYLWIAEKGNWATFANASGLLVNILLNMILIPTIGLHGAVMATAIGNATLVVLMYGLNHRSGCRADVGIWLCAGLPLLLLMSQSMAIVALMLVGVLCVSTNLLLSDEEKSDLQLIARKKLSKYLPR